MTVYEADPDVVRWNLHLIDVCGINNSGSLGSVTQYDKDFSQLGYVTEGYSQPIHVNDEAIAHALQEEQSRLSLQESSQQHPVLAQDWTYSNFDTDTTGFCPLTSNCDHQPISQDTDSTGFYPLTSNWEHQPISPEIEDQSLLDGEVGKRLNQLAAIPHVPKINGDIPSVDEATSDHQRLMDRLEVYDLVESKVSGDGNCQFRSLSDQIYRSTEHHKFVREQVVKQLKSHRELYEGYVPMVYDEYLKKMSKPGEWGDHVTLQAAADSYGVKIFVITSFKDTCYIEILPQSQKSNRIITLSFWAEVHYNSIYPQGEYPVEETRRRKKWWWLG